MATPVFKFQHPDLPGEDLYFIHNTFFELPETIPMDLATFIWYHFKKGKTLEGFFASWESLNTFQTSLKDESFESYFNENKKHQLYDDAIFGQSLKAAQENKKEALKLKEFIDFEKFKTEDIFDYVNPSVNSDYISGNFKLSFFYSRHYFMQFIWDNFKNKLDKSDSYKFDREILLELIKINGLGLSFASENLKKDREVLLDAIKIDYRAFHFVDDSLKVNKNFILEAVKKNLSVFQVLGNGFQNDLDICFEKNKQECLIFFQKEIEELEYLDYLLFEISNDLSDEVNKDDLNEETTNLLSDLLYKKEIQLSSFKEHTKNGPFFSSTDSSFSYELLKNDEDFILNLFKIWPHGLVDYDVFYSGVSSKLLKSKQFVIELLKQVSSNVRISKLIKSNWNWLDYPATFWSDVEFAKVALKVNGSSLQYVSDILKDDREIVLEAVKQNGCALQYASDNFKNDKEIVFEAFKKYFNAFQYASDDLKTDREFVFELATYFEQTSFSLVSNAVVLRLGSGNPAITLQFASDDLKGDKEFVLEVVKKNGYALQFASDNLKDDREIVSEAVKQNSYALQFASDKLKLDIELMSLAKLTIHEVDDDLPF